MKQKEHLFVRTAAAVAMAAVLFPITGCDNGNEKTVSELAGLRKEIVQVKGEIHELRRIMERRQMMDAGMRRMPGGISHATITREEMEARRNKMSPEERKKFMEERKARMEERRRQFEERRNAARNASNVSASKAAPTPAPKAAPTPAPVPAPTPAPTPAPAK